MRRKYEQIRVEAATKEDESYRMSILDCAAYGVALLLGAAVIILIGLPLIGGIAMALMMLC